MHTVFNLKSHHTALQHRLVTIKRINGSERMNKKVIEMESVTNAMKGKDILKRNAIRSDVVKTHAKGNQGCGYGLSVLETDEKRAKKILLEQGLLSKKERGDTDDIS